MSKRILISTSHDDISRSIEIVAGHHLEARGGTKITWATRYEECVRLASSGDFDLVVFFGQTTSAGGTYTEGLLENSVRAIQKIKAKVSTPIIALSTMHETQQQLLSAGADVFVAMPYELKDFKDSLDRCLPFQHLRRRSDPLNPAPVRIIIVDDEPVFVEIVALMIGSKYEVALNSFTSSVEAWAELQKADPDMLIVGGVMPNISGEQIVRGLMERKVSYPILVASGNLSGAVVRGWFPDAPNIAFLQKPFTFEQVVSEVEKHFEPVSDEKHRRHESRGALPQP